MPKLTKQREHNGKRILFVLAILPAEKQIDADRVKAQAAEFDNADPLAVGELAQTRKCL